MEVDFVSVLKVEETTIGGEVSEIDECNCSNCRGGDSYKILRKEISRLKELLESNLKQNRELKYRIKEKDSIIQKSKVFIKAHNHRKIKFAFLNDDNCDLEKKGNEFVDLRNIRMLCSAYTTKKLNQIRADFSMLNQKRLVDYLSTSRVQPEIVDLQKESDQLKNSLRMKTGARSNPSVFKKFPIKSASKHNDSIIKQSLRNNKKPGRVPSKIDGIIPPERYNKTKQPSHQSDKLQCPVCMKKFLKKCSLLSHQKVHSKKEIRGMRCEVVNKGTPQLSSEANELQCPICNKVCLSAAGFVHHQRSHTRKKQNDINEEDKSCASQANELQCTICSKVCRNATGLVHHQRSHIRRRQNSIVREDNNQTSHANEWQCSICSKIFRNATGLANHQRSHVMKPNRIFKFEGLDHSPPYTKESQVCKSENSLHSEIDDNNVDHQQNMNSQQHHRNSTRSKNKKCCQCRECSKTFFSPAQLREHENIHTGEKPFGCNVCSKSFSYRASAFTHSLTHNRFKSFKCSKCKYSFTQRAHLRRHMLVHQRNRSHKCDLCGASFSRLALLSIHKGKIHSLQE